MASSKRSKINLATLKSELDEHDYELLSVDKQETDGPVVVEANKLQHILSPNGDKLYVRLPCTLRVTLSDSNHVQSIAADGPEENAIEAAKHWIKTLVDNGQLEGGSQGPVSGATHQVIEDGRGRAVVERKRFSAY